MAKGALAPLKKAKISNYVTLYPNKLSYRCMVTTHRAPVVLPMGHAVNSFERESYQKEKHKGRLAG